MPGHKDWVRKAHGDLKLARAGASDPETIDTAAYLCHQSAEKALKAFLVFLHQPIPKIHDLEQLLLSCIKSEPLFQTLQHECDYLNPYAINSRYPDDRFSIDQTEITAALEKATKILTLTKKIIEDRQHPNTHIF